jgi:hypothetical protein
MVKYSGAVVLWTTLLAASLGLLAYRLLILSRAEPGVSVWVPHISLCVVSAIIALTMLKRRPPA